ncbi:MAG: hypothetical protein K0S07_388 [Chlamydiales bacterium]|jgi:phospholipid/cholesterol/gamma-HCH transport system substrate-binding protein|nr:hypothetical protein [Chlamydiales bacterium]
MGEQSKNLAIGLFALAAAGITLWVLLFIHPRVGDGGQILSVRFTNIDKVNIGTRVSFAGRPVGEVISIKEVGDELEDRDIYQGHIYIYQLGLKVDSSVNVYSSDEIAIQTSGLLGERQITITPRKSLTPARRVNQEIIYAKSAQSMEEAMENISGITHKAERTLDEVIGIIDANQNDLSLVLQFTRDLLKGSLTLMSELEKENFTTKLSKAVTNLSNVSEEISCSLEEARKGQFIAHLNQTADSIASIAKACDNPQAIKETLSNFQSLSQDVSKAWPNLKEGMSSLSTAAADFSTLSKEGQQAASAINAMVTSMSEGKGTLGQLLVGEDVYLRTVDIFNKVSTLMDDVTHYGLLFHMNRSWQKQRTHRLNQILDVNNPKLFKQRFEQEIDEISTSISRLSILLDSSQRQVEALSQDPKSNRQSIEKLLADLLRRVDGLSSTLKLYNQQFLELERNPEP